VIVFDKLWETMKQKGVTTYRLREHGICSRTVKRLRTNGSVETKTLDKLCDIIDCDIWDIIGRVKNDEK
jgi:DNA-binding Xre family transcriptional regulator